MRAVGANREVIATDALTVARLADAVLSQQHGQEDHRTVLGITVLIPIGAGNADCYTAARPAVTAHRGQVPWAAGGRSPPPPSGTALPSPRACRNPRPVPGRTSPWDL